MKNNEFNSKGGAKKFLYTGPKKDIDDQDDLPWNFGSKNNFAKRPTDNSKFELDDVWSIKRNVNVGGGIKEPKADPLTFNTSKNYYSRYGGNSTNTATEDKSWSIQGQSQRPFSYSYSMDAPNDTSPRQVSQSSTGTYGHTNSFSTRYPRSQGSDKVSSNNNALFNNNRGLAQNGGGYSPSISTYPNSGSVTARDGNMMMSSGGRSSLQGRFMSTKDSDIPGRSRFNTTESQFNQQNKHFW